MIIKSRVKSANGRLLGYIVSMPDDNGIMHDVQLSPAECAKFAFAITNAVCIDAINGVFRAKRGTVIPTMVERTKMETGIQFTNTSANLDNRILGCDFVKLCRKLRQAIRTNRLTVDTGSHNSNSGRNTQYFKFIQACGLTIEGFVKSYLYNLQPCTLRWHITDKASKDITVLVDTGYSIRLYIKLKAKDNIVVSFHDDNINGMLNRSTEKFLDTSYEYSYILLNTGYVASKPVYISRGFSIFELFLNSSKICDDLVIVRTSDLAYQLEQQVMTMMTNSLTEFMDKLPASISAGFSQVGYSKILNFSSYGGSVLNSLALLINIYSVTTSNIERQQLLTSIGVLIETGVYPKDRQVVFEALSDATLGKQNAAFAYAKMLLTSKPAISVKPKK